MAFDIRTYGAVIDGATDDGPAWNDAIAAAGAAGGGKVWMPEGTCLIETPILVDQHNVVLAGEGMGSTLQGDTGADTNLVQFGDGADLYLHCGIEDLVLSSGSSLAPYAKTALYVYDQRNFLARHVVIKPWTSGVADAQDGVGIKFRGRDGCTFDHFRIEADLPIQCLLNEVNDPLADCDHVVFRDMVLDATDAPNPVIVIDPGYLPRHLMFVGRQNWVHGGLYFVDGSTVPRRNDKREYLIIEGVRIEQVGNVGPEVYTVNVNLNPAFPLAQLQVEKSNLGSDGAKQGAIRAKGVRWRGPSDCVYNGDRKRPCDFDTAPVYPGDIWAGTNLFHWDL